MSVIVAYDQGNEVMAVRSNRVQQAKDAVSTAAEVLYLSIVGCPS
jgi:hypothetical protein